MTKLYRHFNTSGELLYIGISLSALARLQQHNLHSHWAEEISRVEIESFDTREKALEAERIAIQSENPKHNIHHKITPLPQSGYENQKVEDSRNDLFARMVHFNPLYTLDEAARVLRCSTATLKKMIEENKIGACLLREYSVQRRGKTSLVRKFVITGWQVVEYLEHLQERQET